MRKLAMICAAALMCVPLSARIYGQTTLPSTPPSEQQAKPEAIQQQVTVYATRTEGRLEDQPTRVELLDQDEIDEKTMMTPGNIVMMLNETSGIRVQNTSPSLGSSTVRIQGMKAATLASLRMACRSSASKVRDWAYYSSLPSILAASRLSRAWRRRCTVQAQWAVW